MANKKIFYIHGITSDQNNNQILKEEAIKRKIAFFSVNLPGHEEKEFNDINLNVESLGEYVKQYMIDNKIKKNIILYGHSLGGAVATYIASNYKKKFKIRKLILEDPLNSAIEMNIRGNKIKIISRKIKEIKESRERNINTVSNSVFDWYKKINQKIPKNRWKDFLILAKNIVSKQSLNNLDFYYQKLRIKTYVVFGENDFIIPCQESINNLTSLNKRISCQIIQKAGHSPNKENPQEYRTWLTEVL